MSTMNISVGDSVRVENFIFTAVTQLKPGLWYCLDSNDIKHFIYETQMSKACPTYEFDGVLLEHGIVFADHIKDGELERHRIEKDMICQMNKHSKGEWTSPKGVKWRWDLNELSFWRNDVFFAVRLMTPCGRWI